MSSSPAFVALKQLQELVDEYEGFRSQSKYGDASDVMSNTKVSEMKTRAIAAIARISGQHSVYYEQSQSVITKEKMNDWDHLGSLIGILQSLIVDINGGYIRSIVELTHFHEPSLTHEKH